jgi:hypothetical protein
MLPQNRTLQKRGGFKSISFGNRQPDGSGWRILAHAAIGNPKSPVQWDWNCCFLVIFL